MVSIKQFKYAGSFWLALWLGALSCGDNKNDSPKAASQAVTIDSSRYPAIVSKSGTIAQYEKARWSLYCLYAKESLEFLPFTGIRDTVTFGELRLNFAHLRKSGDSTEYYFNFYYHDTVKCDFNLIDNYSYLRGAGFTDRSDSISYWISPTTARYWTSKGTKTKYEHPLQPDVIAYIKRNQNKLNPWFLAEARKREIIP